MGGRRIWKLAPGNSPFWKMRRSPLGEEGKTTARQPRAFPLLSLSGREKKGKVAGTAAATAEGRKRRAGGIGHGSEAGEARRRRRHETDDTPRRPPDDFATTPLPIDALLHALSLSLRLRG